MAGEKERTTVYIEKDLLIQAKAKSLQNDKKDFNLSEFVTNKLEEYINQG